MQMAMSLDVPSMAPKLKTWQMVTLGSQHSRTWMTSLSMPLRACPQT